jgi:hypothetical protein
VFFGLIKFFINPLTFYEICIDFSQNLIHVLLKVLVLCRVLHFSEPLEISEMRFVKHCIVNL